MLKPYHYKTKREAGVDEAGRGCYAGPVFAAAVVLPKDFFHPLLNDSKQLTEKERDELRPIIEKEAIDFAVSQCCNETIDRINILQASLTAMHQALDCLKKVPELILVDGNRFRRYREVKHKCVVQGDGIYASIAAASVLAKTYRDEYMVNLHKEFQSYYWDSNKGYGTRAHRDAILQHGVTKYHRVSFNIFEVSAEPVLAAKDPV